MSNDVQQRPAAWEGFVGGNWETNVDVRDFIENIDCKFSERITSIPIYLQGFL